MYDYGYKNSFRRLLGDGGGGALDPDAEAFITAASITDATQQSAVNQLVLDLKTANIWTKMKAVYPFVGGTATSHKWNLKDPRDLDAAFRLTFSGGWTHSATGALPNGTNGYANTYLDALNDLSASSHSIGVYLNTNLITTGRNHSGIFSPTFGIRSHTTTEKRGYLESTTLVLVKSGLDTSTQMGFWAISKRADNDRVMICSDETFIYNTTSNSTALSSLNVYLGARNNSGTADLFDTMSHAFDFISEGLNDTELTNLKTAVETFQTTLSRNV